MKAIVGVDVIICKLKEKVMYLHSSPPTLIFISCLAFPAFPSLFPVPKQNEQSKRHIQILTNSGRSQQPGI